MYETSERAAPHNTPEQNAAQILTHVTPGPTVRRRSARFLKTLRKVHLYVGLWGALLGLLFGATGILLNHRTLLKFPLATPQQVIAQMPLADRSFATPEQLSDWLRAELKLNPQTMVRINALPARSVLWEGIELQQPPQWTINFNSIDKSIVADYMPGNRFVKLDTTAQTPLGTLMRLHKGVGIGIAWVLLADTIAGGLIVLCITGLLLWSRLHPLRLATVGTSLGGISMAIWLFWGAL